MAPCTVPYIHVLLVGQLKQKKGYYIFSEVHENPTINSKYTGTDKWIKSSVVNE